MFKGCLVSSYFMALYRFLRSRAVGNICKDDFFPQNISRPFSHLFSVNNALRNAYKMMVSVKLPLNVINQYKIETSGGVYIHSTHFNLGYRCTCVVRFTPL